MSCILADPQSSTVQETRYDQLVGRLMEALDTDQSVMVVLLRSEIFSVLDRLSDAALDVPEDSNDA